MLASSKTTSSYKEVKCTETFPSVRVPCWPLFKSFLFENLTDLGFKGCRDIQHNDTRHDGSLHYDKTTQSFKA
jgi:hypothetical protein